jgi:hypothetical protein
MTRVWTCQRVTNGKRCGAKNDARKVLCAACGKRRPPRKRPDHLRALTLPYEEFLRRNGGIERCGICDRPPTTNRRLDRDHSHITGEPRGLLCPNCNRLLHRRVNEAWLLAAMAYLRRTEAA